MAAEAIKLMRANKDQLEKIFKGHSYAWAWIQLQAGDRENTKKLILAEFEKEFAEVMKSTEAVTGLGHTPLGDAENLLKAASSLTNEEEKKDMEAKMQKMKLHVSTLPQSMIMT